MAKRRGYISGTAAQFGVQAPSYEGGSGGLLLLLLGAYLLFAFITGRLSWLTNTIDGVFQAYNANQTPAATGTGSTFIPPPATTPYQPPPGANAAYANRPRPRTPGVYV